MKNVVMWAVSYFNWLWVPLAEELKKAYGSNIHFIVSYHQGIEDWKRLDTNGVIDSFTAVGDFFSDYDKLSEPSYEVYEKAKYYEGKYGTLVSDCLQCDRHLGRGFFPAGAGHPKSALSKKSDYLKSVNLFNKAFEFWEEYFREKKPDLIIGAASSVVGKAFSSVAHRNNVPVRVLNTSGYKSFYYWGHSEYYDTPEIERNYKRIDDISRYADEREISSVTRNVIGEHDYKKFAKYGSLSTLTKRMVRKVGVHSYRRLKGIISMGNYGLFDEIKCLYDIYRSLNRVDSIKTIEFDDLKNMSFVLYPLQEEPEAALGMFSPEFNEQLGTVEMIAKNLPAGTKLVVKEHIFGVGRRPKDFYSTLKEIPNVEMLSVYEYASKAAQFAKCVATITSTVGIEAVIMGVPVITFGVHNNYGFLHHVHLVKSWNELRPLLAKLSVEPDADEKKRRREDGLRYLAALKASSMDLSKSDCADRKRGPATAEEREIFYSALMRSLEFSGHEERERKDKYTLHRY
ncbi:MAG: hypothetical protein JW800_06835 [Candidatus Omnitrophica bacterium]|nr:hypothetical protein [Candidatus Omnitrophota bacterium]